jgi:hypothetical protein
MGTWYGPQVRTVRLAKISSPQFIPFWERQHLRLALFVRHTLPSVGSNSHTDALRLLKGEQCSRGHRASSFVQIITDCAPPSFGSVLSCHQRPYSAISLNCAPQFPAGRPGTIMLPSDDGILSHQLDHRKLHSGQAQSRRCSSILRAPASTPTKHHVLHIPVLKRFPSNRDCDLGD